MVETVHSVRYISRMMRLAMYRHNSSICDDRIISGIELLAPISEIKSVEMTEFGL